MSYKGCAMSLKKWLPIVLSGGDPLPVLVVAAVPLVGVAVAPLAPGLGVGRLEVAVAVP